MWKPVTALLFLYITLLFSCTDARVQTPVEVHAPQKLESDVVKTFDTKPGEITADFSTWYNYTYYNIKLSRDFIALNKDSVVINKQEFLKQLQTGNYIPIKIFEKGSEPAYKLFLLKSVDPNIGLTIKQLATSELENYKWVGKELPVFNWTDLDGNSYNKENTKDKIVVVKCWFINCVACVKEFPELNQLVEDNKGRNDVVFISLATDSAQPLKDFLTKRAFAYAVVPGQGQYMEGSLNISTYPTHLLVGKDGKISHVSNSAEDLIWALNKELAKGF